MADVFLDDLDASQRAAVTSPARALAILAPAGSGKTRVLTRRIAYRVRAGDAMAAHVLAVTFTRHAAGELVTRIGRLGVDGPVTASTFHALALGQLRRRAAERNQTPPQILDDKARLLGPIVGSRGGAAARVAAAAVAGEIEWAKARMIVPARYALAARAVQREVPRPVDDTAAVYSRYEEEKRRRRLLDFDDVLAGCADAIETDDEFAAAVRWRFRHVFVDEFQDVTPLQLRVLRGVLGTNDDITVVGDPAQSIYAFAGADASPLVEFDRAFPGGATIALTHTYRSTPAIVQFAESALDHTDMGARVAPVAVRADDELPTLTAYADDTAEAVGVAEGCRRAHLDGVPWERIAVLFRSNAQSARFESALARRGVPFRTGTDRRFAQRAPVRALIDRLRSLDADEPGRSLASLLADLAADSDESLDTSELRAHRDALLDLGRDYQSIEHGAATLGGFAAWLDTRTRADAGTTPGVDLLTFHRAKGLEWSVVFVTGIEEGLVPIAGAVTPEARSDERRLLHVALSRAENSLHCSWARVRTVGTRRAVRDRSPWLDGPQDAVDRAAWIARPTRTHLAELRETLARATPPPSPPERARRLRR